MNGRGTLGNEWNHAIYRKRYVFHCMAWFLVVPDSSSPKHSLIGTSNRSPQLRRRLEVSPPDNVEHLWQELEAFEMALNNITVRLHL
jgi:hypothetical protein